MIDGPAIEGHWNVVVSGGRIAGAATAAALARYAGRILVVDASRPDMYWPQQATWDRAGTLLWADLGLLDTVLAGQAPRLRGHTFRTAGGVTEHEYPDPDGHGYRMSLPREILDPALLDAATRAGDVTVVRPARVRDVLVADGLVRGATIRRAGRDHLVTCDLLVLADGRLSRNADRLGAAPYTDLASPWSALLAYYADLPLPVDRAYFSRGTGSILIATPVGPARWCLSAGLHRDLVAACGEHPTRLFHRLVAADPQLGPAVAAGRRTTSVGGAGKLRMRRRPMSGPGWAIVGDAGYHLDPMTALGTRAALTTVRILRDRVAARGRIDGTGLAGLTAERDAALAEEWAHTERVVSAELVRA